MKCLKDFKSINEYKVFIETLKINDWKIEQGLMNNRGEAIRFARYTKELKRLFKESKLFRMNVSVAEIVTWLDTFIHLNRLLSMLEKNKYDCRIILEYEIELSKHSRVDVILEKDDKICLLEFSTVDKYQKMKSSYHKKKLELIIYKDLMSYYKESYNIYTLPFISLYEYMFKKPIPKHIETNKKQVEFTYKFITRYVFDNN